MAVEERASIGLVGEMESSPYIQMVVAGLGHLATLQMEYIMIGLTLSHEKLVDLYLFQNEGYPNTDAIFLQDLSKCIM